MIIDGLISIIIPVYNVEEYIDKCIMSIVNQSYKKLEVIIVNDGSKDNSGIICDMWANKDKRIKVVHQDNFGVSCARNKGMTYIKGEYFLFVDGDDYLEPKMLEVMVDRMKSDNKISAVFCGYYLDYESKICKVEPKIAGCISKTEILNAIFIDNGYYTALWNKLFRNNDGISKFDKKYTVGEDEIWLYKQLKNVDTIYLEPQPMYHWIQRNNSASHGVGFKKNNLSAIESKIDALELIKNYYPEYEDIAQKRLFTMIFSVYLLAYKDRLCKETHQLKKLVLQEGKRWMINPKVRYKTKFKYFVVFILTNFKISNKVINKLF